MYKLRGLKGKRGKVENEVSPHPRLDGSSIVGHSSKASGCGGVVRPTGTGVHGAVGVVGVVDRGGGGGGG